MTRQLKFRRLASLLVGVVPFLAGCSPHGKSAEQGFLASGKQYMARKDYAAAVIQFQNAMKAQPSDAEAYYQLALAEEGTGNALLVVRNLRKAVQLDPHHASATLKLSTWMTRAKDPEIVQEAERRTRVLLDDAPDNPDALRTLALAELRLDKFDAAEKHLRRALEKFPAHLKSAETLASIELSRNNPAGAEQVLFAAVGKDPHSADALLALGRFFIMRGDPRRAEAYFRRALDQDPASVPAMLDLANAELRLGHLSGAEEIFRRVSSLGDRECRPLHAIFLFQHGDRQAAIQEFEQLSRQDPSDHAAQRRLASAYLAIGRNDDVERLLTRELQYDPKDVEARLLRGINYVFQRRPSQALSDLEHLIALGQNTAPVHLVLGRVHLARGSSDLAQRDFQEALRLDPRLLPARVELARSLIVTRKPRIALEVLQKASVEQAKTLPVIVQRNWALWACGLVPELQAGVRQGLAIRRTSDLVLQAAMLKLNSKDAGAADSLAAEVLARNPNDLRAMELLARAWLAQGRSKQFAARLQQEIDRHPDVAPLHYFLGTWLGANGDPDAARTELARAASLQPGYLLAELALARLDASQRNWDVARSRLSALIAKTESTAALYLALGQVDEAAGRYQSAVDSYRQVLQLDKNNLTALNNMAYRLANDLNQVDEGYKLAAQALALAPNDPSVQDTYGWVCYRSGLYASAVKSLETATSTEPTASRWYHLAMAYPKTGNVVAGQRALRAALSLDPSLPEANAARAALGLPQ